MITNETTGEVIVDDYEVFSSMFSQAIGLMFRKKPITKGYVFELPWVASWDVTNLFVLQDIDVLWLDADKRVHKKASVPAWKARVAGKAGTHHFIELPAGAARNVSMGDRLSWNKKAL